MEFPVRFLSYLVFICIIKTPFPSFPCCLPEYRGRNRDISHTGSQMKQKLSWKGKQGWSWGGKEGEGVGAGTEEEEREVAGEKGIEFGISLLVSVQLNRQLHTKRCSGPWLFSCPSPRSTVWAARTFLEHLWIFFQGRWIQMAVFIQRKLSCLCTIRSSQQIKSSRWRHQDMLNLDMSKAAVAL